MRKVTVITNGTIRTAKTPKGIHKQSPAKTPVTDRAQLAPLSHSQKPTRLPGDAIAQANAQSQTKPR